MALELTAAERALLGGEEGEGARMAMSILVRIAEVRGADRLIPVTAAHIDSALYMGDATLEYAERLADLGAKVAVPATLNVAGVDPHGWERWAVPPEWAEKARRQMAAYQSMGCVPSWTCAPYQTEERPAFGDQIAWGESSAIVFANSVLGARTERYPDLLDICAAITGRVPAVGLHLTKNRAGQVLFHFRDIPPDLLTSDELYPVLGHLVGKLAGDRVAVLEGLGVTPSEDQLKALGAAAASSGAVALFHWVGVTPEAPTLEEALQWRRPEETHDVVLAELRAARDELSTAEGERLDIVVLGSPHFSLAEFRALAPLLAGRRRHPDVRFLVTTGRGVKLIAQDAGVLDPLHAFGGEVTVDTCILTTPMLPPEIGVLMTNSAKYAYYTPGLLGREMAFGSTEDCVKSAVLGRVTRDDTLWNRPERVLEDDTGLPSPPPQAGRRRRARRMRSGSSVTLRGRALIPGDVTGVLLVSQEPLSFWGGYDSETGELIDRRHPLSGEIAAGRILAIPGTRGSSTTTAVLLEAIRHGTAPAAILTSGTDSFLVLSAVVADEMYGKALPLVALEEEDFRRLTNGASASVKPDGTVVTS